jgi:hypothetical protein
MSRGRVAIGVVFVMAFGGSAVDVRGVSRPDLSGTWTLNRQLSEFPREAGFDPDWHDSETGGQSGTGRSGGGGSGRRGGGGGGRSGGGGSSSAGTLSPVFESEEDSKKIRELINEVLSPSPKLTITQTDAAVTIVDAGGRTRRFHPGGKEDTLELEAGPVAVISKWENGQLLLRCQVEKNRELRYRYSRDPGTRQLAVEIQFADHGRGAVIKRIYASRPPNRSAFLMPSR